jgi:hypothetical protein
MMHQPNYLALPESPATEQRNRLLLMAEAAELGLSLDQHHVADPMSEACRVCGFRLYEPADGLWWHLPAVENLQMVQAWLAEVQGQ